MSTEEEPGLGSSSAGELCCELAEDLFVRQLSLFLVP